MQACQETSIHFGDGQIFSEVSKLPNAKWMVLVTYQYTKLVIERYQMRLRNIGTFRVHLERHACTYLQTTISQQVPSYQLVTTTCRLY